MKQTDFLIIAVLIIIFIPAIKGFIDHLKGEGDCCGGKKEKPSRKRIKGTPIRTETLSVSGMHCVNCKNSIERKLNELEGVVAKVDLENKKVRVFLYDEVDMDKIRTIIDQLGFKVSQIENGNK